MHTQAALLLSPISTAPAVEPAMIDRRALGPFLARGFSSLTGTDAIGGSWRGISAVDVDAVVDSASVSAVGYSRWPLAIGVWLVGLAGSPP